MEYLIEAKTPSLLLHELAHRRSIVSFYCNRRVRFAAMRLLTEERLEAAS
jgi:hypothetical protein